MLICGHVLRSCLFSEFSMVLVLRLALYVDSISATYVSISYISIFSNFCSHSKDPQILVLCPDLFLKFGHGFQLPKISWLGCPKCTSNSQCPKQNCP